MANLYAGGSVVQLTALFFFVVHLGKHTKGYYMSKFETQVRKHARALLHGTVLAVDPASGGTSMPGWAAFRDGKLIKSGTLEINSKRTIQKRLHELFELLEETAPDVLLVEQLGKSKTTHMYLLWSVGVIVAAVSPKILIEVPISSWKKHAGKDHKKSDENDARAIGEVTLDLARRHASDSGRAA
jgi:hypothetical protein